MARSVWKGPFVDQYILKKADQALPKEQNQKNYLFFPFKKYIQDYPCHEIKMNQVINPKLL